MNNEPQPLNGDSLDQAIAELGGMRIPEPPTAELLVARLPLRSLSSAGVTFVRPDAMGKSDRLQCGFRFTTAAFLLSTLVGWLIVSWPRGDVLAQAIAMTEKFDIVRCKFATTVHTELFVDGQAKNTETIYFDLKAPRFRIEQPVMKTLNNTCSTTWFTVQDNRADRWLIATDTELIIDEDKADDVQRKLIKGVKADGMLGKRARLHRIGGKGMFPFTHSKTDKTLLEMLREFQNRKNVTSIQDTLDGRSTMKYRLEEPDRTSTLWIDLETKRPVRIEEERPNKGQKITDYKWTLSDFEWDVKDLTGQLFSVQPPAGYTLEDRTAEEN